MKESATHSNEEKKRRTELVQSVMRVMLLIKHQTILFALVVDRGVVEKAQT